MPTYDLLPYLCPPNGQRYHLSGLGDETCQSVQARDGWIEFRKNKHMEEFYVTDTVIGRGADTSEISTDGVHPVGHFYVQYTKAANGALSYGAAWAKRFMAVGEKFHRSVHVVFFDYLGNVVNSYDEASDLTLVDHFDRLTFPQSDVVLNDVLMLQWGGEERYYYGKGYGLVGWNNQRTGTASFVSALSGDEMIPFPHAIPRPAVPAPGAAAPVECPQDQGALQGGVISASSVVNVRDLPTTKGSSVVGQVKNGDRVTYRPGLPGQPVSHDGYTWQVVESINGIALKQPGWVSSLAAIQPADLIFNLNTAVPFFDQNAAGATLAVNDCGAACARMLYGFLFAEFGLLPPSFVTVDDMTAKTALPSKDKQGLGLTIAEVVALLCGFGLKAVPRSDLTTEFLAALLHSQRPVIVLLHDSYLYKGINTPLVKSYGGHYVILTGVISLASGAVTGFVFHDPLVLKADQHIDAGLLTQAMHAAASSATDLLGITLA